LLCCLIVMLHGWADAMYLRQFYLKLEYRRLYFLRIVDVYCHTKVVILQKKTRTRDDFVLWQEEAGSIFELKMKLLFDESPNQMLLLFSQKIQKYSPYQPTTLNYHIKTVFTGRTTRKRESYVDACRGYWTTILWSTHAGSEVTFCRSLGTLCVLWRIWIVLGTSINACAPDVVVHLTNWASHWESFCSYLRWDSFNTTKC